MTAGKDPDELDDLLDHCVAAVKAAGEIALGYFGTDIESWNKSSTPHRNDPVSAADIEIDHFLKNALGAHWPGYGWLSEETEDDLARLDAPRLWVVDPIDGTRAFLKRQPHFAISVALVEAGDPIVGVVLNPATGELFTATKDGGAQLNGDGLRVTARGEIKDCRMMAYPQLFHDRRWRSPWPEMRVEQRNSAAYRLALVAAGNFDATLSLSPKHDWDIAAAHLIVSEAGGLVTCHEGKVPKYNKAHPVHPSMVAAGPILHGLILDRVRHMELPQTPGS